MAENTTFDNNYQRAFGMKVDLLQQQMDPRLRNSVIEEPIKGNEAKELPQVGFVSLVPRTVRQSDTPIVPIPHRTRILQGLPYEAAELIDPIDQNRFELNFEPSFTRTFAAAAARRHDLNIIQAFFATATVGKAGAATQAFNTTDFGIVSSSVGLTPTKLRSAVQKLFAAENMKDEGDYKWFICVKAKQMSDLLATTEVTSADFNTVRALTVGTVDDFMGLSFIRSEQIEATGGEDQIPVWVKYSMRLGVAEWGTARIGERADKSYGVQVYYRIDSGATRMDEKGVVRILCA